MLKSSDLAYFRLIEEKANLAKKVENLEAFVRSARRGENEVDLTLSELQLLEEQLHYMRGYLRCLNARISQVNS